MTAFWCYATALGIMDGMNQRKRCGQAALIASFVALFLLSYCGAYVATQSRPAQTGRNGGGTFTVRYYPADWHVVLFGPLAALETVLSSRDVQLEYVPD